jgi:dipeptidyl-peptidase-4
VDRRRLLGDRQERDEREREARVQDQDVADTAALDLRADMKKTPRRPVLVGCLCAAWAAGILAGSTPITFAAQKQPLTVERLASLPSLIGTAPQAPVWSPDGRRLAFLWNDSAMPFRDVWLIEIAGRQPVRLANMETRNAAAPSAAAIAGPNADAAERLARDVARRHDPGITEVIWTPDGNSLVFVCQGGLFRVRSDGAGLEPLAVTPGSRSSIAFSPDGRMLSWLQDGDLWLANQQTKGTTRATFKAVPAVSSNPGGAFSYPDAALSGPRWSPDGRHVAMHWDDRRAVRKRLFPTYLADETQVLTLRRDVPGENDQVRAIAVFSLESGSVRTIDLPDATDRRISSYQWSPDSRKLLIDQNSENARDRWIYSTSVADLSAEELLHERREIAGTTTTASALWTSDWLSDGDGIIFISDIIDSLQLYSLALGDKTPRALTPPGWSVVSTAFDGNAFAMSPRTREVFFIATKKNPYERQVYRMPEQGGTVVDVTSLPGTHQPFVAGDGRHVALLHSSDVTPTELYVTAAEGGTEQRITRSPPPEFSRHAWIQPRYVTFKSRTDGVNLHGRLIEPPNLDRSKKYPVIIGPVYSNTVRNQWKGPHNTLQQYLAREGEYIGLQVDIRGSVGYDRAFRDRAVGDFSGITIEDLHSGVEYLQSLPYVDRDRIGIWGWSYGGLLTTMSLFQKPGVYKAGVAGAPATNVWHATTGEVDLAGRPSVNQDVFRKNSPVTFAEGLRDHLMIIHGMQDDIVLFRDSAALAEKLMMLDKTFDFVMLPNSVHDAMRRDYVATHVLRKIVEHFDRYVGRGARPARASHAK